MLLVHVLKELWFKVIKGQLFWKILNALALRMAKTHVLAILRVRGYVNHTTPVTYWEHHQGASTGSTWFPAAAAAGSADFVARRLPDSSAYLAAPPPLGLLALPVIQPEIQPTNTL